MHSRVHKPKYARHLSFSMLGGMGFCRAGRFQIKLLIVAFSLSCMSSIAAADDPASPPVSPNTPAACSAAHSAAVSAVYACINSLMPVAENQKIPLTSRAAQVVEDCLAFFGVGSISGVTTTDLCIRAGYEAIDEDIMACIDTFRKNLDELKTCGGAEAMYRLYCAVRRNISENNALKEPRDLRTITYTRKNFNPPPICGPPHSSVRITIPPRPPKPPCDDPAVKTCWDQCNANNPDPNDTCHQSCNAIAAVICGGATDASSTPQNSQRQLRSDKFDRTRTNVKSQSKPKTDTKSFGVGNDEGTKKTAIRKNNLDRHDLGPTFVSPDTSTPGGRTTARGVAGSKTKATTSSDGVSKLKGTTSTDAVLPALSGPTGGFGASAPQQIK